MSRSSARRRGLRTGSAGRGSSSLTTTSPPLAAVAAAELVDRRRQRLQHLALHAASGYRVNDMLSAGGEARCYGDAVDVEEHARRRGAAQGTGSRRRRPRTAVGKGLSAGRRWRLVDADDPRRSPPRPRSVHDHRASSCAVPTREAAVPWICSPPTGYSPLCPYCLACALQYSPYRDVVIAG